MTPLPAALGDSTLMAWRLDQRAFAATWDSGEGARIFAGRWSSHGRKIVYCSIDPATAILEVAVHMGFEALDEVPHVLTSTIISRPGTVHVVHPDGLPDARWLRQGIPAAAQREFGDRLLSAHPFVLIPSAVSLHSWNLIFDADVANGLYARHSQQDFVLDARLHRTK